MGWLTAMGWPVYLAGICFMVGSVIQGLIVLNNLNTYVYQSWHGTLITIGVILFVVVFTTLLAVRLPLIEGLLLIVHIGGLFAIIVPLWVLAPRGTVKETLFTFTTTGGWSNLGLASLIGMVNPIGVLIGYDCTVHMCKSFFSCRGHQTIDRSLQPRKSRMLRSYCREPSSGLSCRTVSWP